MRSPQVTFQRMCSSSSNRTTRKLYTPYQQRPWQISDSLAGWSKRNKKRKLRYRGKRELKQKIPVFRRALPPSTQQPLRERNCEYFCNLFTLQVMAYQMIQRESVCAQHYAHHAVTDRRKSDAISQTFTRSAKNWKSELLGAFDFINKISLI